jgi:hypothetical protein
MRMWMVPPRHLCRRHLLGEHVELHMLAGSIGRGRSLAGFVEGGLIEPASAAARHGALVREMRARGYRHSSDDLNGLAALVLYPPAVRWARVDVATAWADLLARCPDCLGLAPAGAPGA